MAKSASYAPVIPTAEPFLFLGDNTGILLVHGFTGTPKEMRTMGEYLAAHGKTVLGIRLPGHATQPVDMQHKRWMDWLDAVEDGYHLLRSAGREVFIMGLSMGGILTLTAAARLPVRGVVAMSTPYILTDNPLFPYVEYIAPFVPNMSKGSSDWHDKTMEKEHVDYPNYPTRSFVELRELGKVMRAGLPNIKVPVLLVHSRKDGALPLDNMQKIYDQLGTSNKSMLVIEQSGHVITRDLEREKVFAAALAFVEKHKTG